MKLFVAITLLWRAAVVALPAATDADVLVYGATPAGIAAALAAAKDGRSVLLIEPTSRIGGLVSSGLSHTDFHSLESLTGAFLDFANRIEAHYTATYGADSQQVEDSFHGTFAEPKINLHVFEAMLAEEHSLALRKGLRLASVKTRGPDTARVLESATFTTADASMTTLSARVFVDASYEGDLMAAAGIPWRVGREGRAEYDESLAPETPDAQLQAYNFRFIMTRDPANRLTPIAPPGYRREDFLPVADLLETGKFKRVFDYPSGCLFKAQTPPLPNGKYDINDVSRGLVRLSLPGQNLGWPDGDAATRERIFAEHLRDQAGLLYFIQNDESVPATFRDEAREWGWCRDEFTETAGVPPQLYVREARRMVGHHVFVQADGEWATNDARAVLHRDSIATGDYGNNCHGTAHEGPRFGGKHTGELYHPVPPYQIPYGVLVPKSFVNVLVPGAVSSSHVGFCALRLEPIWMSLGQAAGHAAAMAVRRESSVQAVDVAALQRRLHVAGSATVYVSDVPPGHPDFGAVQWWGTAGGLHGLEPRPANPRGKNLHGQYYEAAPGHAVDLDRILDPALARRWRALALKLGVPASQLRDADGRVTRGDFIRAAATP